MTHPNLARRLWSSLPTLAVIAAVAGIFTIIWLIAAEDERRNCALAGDAPTDGEPYHSSVCDELLNR